MKKNTAIPSIPSKYRCYYTSLTENRLFYKDCAGTYVVDHSGRSPTSTDDGPLRFADEEYGATRYRAALPIVLKASEICPNISYAIIKVVAERDEGEWSCFTANITLEAALLLAEKHNLPVVAQVTLYNPNGKEV